MSPARAPPQEGGILVGSCVIVGWISMGPEPQPEPESHAIFSNPPHVCELCCLTFSGPAQLHQHLSGRRHEAAKRRAGSARPIETQRQGRMQAGAHVVPASERDLLLQSMAGTVAKAVSSKLTLIITTSPCKGGSAVHCALFHTLFASFRQIDGLEGCRVIVVCDGYKLVKSESSGRPKSKVKVKNGSISPEMASGYADFLSWLETEISESKSTESVNWLSPYKVEVLRLLEWRGWSSAVEHALQLVHTPFVMVIQDDRVFVPRYRELGLLLDAIALTNRSVSAAHDRDVVDDCTACAKHSEAEAGDGTLAAPSAEKVGYVLFPTNKFRRHENEMRSLAGKHGRKLAPDQVFLPLDAKVGVSKMPTFTKTAIAPEHVPHSQPESKPTSTAVCMTGHQSQSEPFPKSEHQPEPSSDAGWGYYAAAGLTNQCVTALTRQRGAQAESRASSSSLSISPSTQTPVSAVARQLPTPTTEVEYKLAMPEIRLIRCWRVLDTTHVATVQWYRNLYSRFPGLTRKGMFAEDCLSAQHMADSLSGEGFSLVECLLLVSSLPTHL